MNKHPSQNLFIGQRSLSWLLCVPNARLDANALRGSKQSVHPLPIQVFDKAGTRLVIQDATSLFVLGFRPEFWDIQPLAYPKRIRIHRSRRSTGLGHREATIHQDSR